MYYNNRYNNQPTVNRNPYPEDYARDYSYYDYSHQNFYAPQRQQQYRQQGSTKNQNQQRERTSERTNVNISPGNNSSSNPLNDDLKHYLCPGCNLQFNCLSRNNKFTGRVPLILNCYHTVCQECIYKGAQVDNIICPTCKKPSELTRKYLIDNLQDVFPPNYYLFGLIMWSRPYGNTYKQPILVPTQVTLSNKRLIKAEQASTLDPETGEKCCFLSCNKVASLRCQDCNDVYCADCCTVVHKSAKSLWCHVQSPITKGKFSADLDKCLYHTTMDMELFCRTCETNVCCYCFLEKHEGHERDFLSKLNDVELAEFRTCRDKAGYILKRLLISQKKLKNICSTNTSVMEAKICSYFADLHAQLHFVQKDLQKQVTRLEGVGKSDTGLDTISSTVDKSVNTLKHLLVAADSMNQKKINLRGLLQKLKDVQGTPCYLVGEDGTSVEPLEFEADPLLQDVRSLFAIRKMDDFKYTLVGEDKLPEGYFVDPAEESDAESCVSSLLQSCKKEEVNQQNVKISTASTSAHNAMAPTTKRWKKLDGKQVIASHLQIPTENEMVEVTHIESLECFYVQLKKFQSRFSQMNKDIENYIKMGASPVSHPQINELYLAMYVTKSEKMWCRGRITDVKTGGGSPSYEVFFIDYGSTQILPVDKLREITPNLAQRKPFAIQCELYNPTYASWGKNAHVYMGKMINGKEVFMMVKTISNGIYQVDLMVSSSDKGLTSIVDILIHTCSNALSTSSSGSSISLMRKESFVPECKIFSNSMKFKKHQMENVILSNVVDPHHVFVHMAAYVESLRKMASQMKHHYKNSTYQNCIPIEGSYVVVDHKDPIRGHWHRGLVKKVDMNASKAHVLLVDWGNNVIVSWSSIRLLHDSFTRLESQAILVKLAHVEPYQGDKSWSEKATFFLQKNFRTQETLKMVVHNVEPLEVALFESLACVDICINAQLVQEKLADSTGKISQTLEWPQNEQGQPEFTEDEGFMATLLKKVDEIIDEDDLEDKNQVPSSVKQQIEVIKSVGPDLIYIKFVHLESQEQKLHKELQICYQKERQLKDTWQEKEDCVVIFNDCYVRGKIMGKVGDKYQVNVYDKAVETVLPKQKIFVYSDYFRRYPNIIFKAHLANIRPAGGDKWSLMSIEMLEKVFDKHRNIYATKVSGDTSKKSIPMLMWYAVVEIGGALEPSQTKFVSINNLLIKMGFAYKIKEEGETEGKKTESGDEEGKTELTVSAMVHASENQSDKSLNDSTSSEKAKDSEEVAQSNEAKDKASLNTSDETTSSAADWNELIEKEETGSQSKQDSPYHTREAEITDWKPAFPIKKREFNAWITCAETEGILYLRDEDLQPVYKDMEANLKQYFDSQPPLKEKPDWRPGQICTIAYNDYWYRGKILKVNSPEEIVAIMIDFGSDHVLSPKQLYREILYPEIPAFASRIKLNNVFAKSGMWLSSDYETLLEKVTEYAKVIIEGPLEVDLPLAEVFTHNGENINQLLVNICPNLTRCLKPLPEKSEDDIVVIEKEEPLSLPDKDETPEEEVDTTTMVFKLEPLPDTSEKRILMSIAWVLSYNKIVIKNPKESIEELYELSEKIQDSYATQPVLEDIKTGMPCICPYAEDGVWYRAQVHNIDGIDCGYVFVFFVDFGNVESVSTKDVRAMRPEWFNLPVPCYIATVNFELKFDNHLEHVFQHMKKLMGKNKRVEIVSEEPLTVGLYEEDGELCYQSLIDSGLLRNK